jgi:hypothetical protein
MGSLGISPRVAGGRVEVAAVGIDRSAGNASANPDLVFRVDPNEDEAQQLRALTNAVRPLVANGVDAVVIGTFDYRQNQRIADWMKQRLRAEGALAAMAREHSGVVEVFTGREMALVHGLSKDELQEMATGVLPDRETGAVMAALTAEALLAQ